MPAKLGSESYESLRVGNDKHLDIASDNSLQNGKQLSPPKIESASELDIWQKLRLVVVHATEAYIPLDINQSPFNVGLPIKLPEFSLEQVQDLAVRHRLDWAKGLRATRGGELVEYRQ